MALSVPCPWPGRSAGGHSQVTYDALAHTAFDGDADAICLDSAAGHAGLAMRLFVNLLQRDISGFQTSKSPGVGGGAKAKPVVDGVGWSEKRESEVCAPIWLVRLVGVNPGNGRLLMEDKDAAWKLGGEFLGSFVVLNLLKSSRCRSPQLIRLLHLLLAAHASANQQHPLLPSNNHRHAVTHPLYSVL